MCKEFRRVTALAALMVGMFVGVSSVQAEPVWKFLDGGEEAQGDIVLIDDNREYLIDNVFTEVGQIDVGDAIRGHLIWTRVVEGNLNSSAGLNGNPGGAGIGQAELTAVMQLQVTGKTEVSPGEYTFTFGPDPSFAEAQALGLGGQAMMIFYEDATADAALDYNDPTSPLHPNTIDDGTDSKSPDPDDVGVASANEHEEFFISTATNGDYFWALGFTGDVEDGAATAADGEGWASLDGMEDNVLPFFDSNHNVTFTNSAFSVNRLNSPVESGQGDSLALRKQESQFGSNFTVDFNGSQEWVGIRNQKTAFEIGSHTQLAFSVIPLPSAAAMGLLMMAGLGGEYVRRRKVQAA